MIDVAASMQPQPQRQLLHTPGLQHGDMLVAIREYVSTLLAVQVEIEDARKLTCEWSVWQCGGCVLTKGSMGGATAVRVRRTAPALPEGESYNLLRVRSGRLDARQRGTEAALGADLFLLLHANEPYEYIRHKDAMVIDLVRIPSWLLRSRLGQPEKYLGRIYACGVGLPAFAMDFVRLLHQRIPEVAPTTLGPLTAQLADLVAFALTAQGTQTSHAESSVRAALLERLRKFIDQNLADRGLTPRSIAAANDISERYLHRIFEDCGQSVCDYIRSQRVAACRRTLENPPQPRRPIAEIASAHGFRSSSQFTRAYRREFGAPPSAWRRRAK